jgi:opacity protein-like surface antigen
MKKTYLFALVLVAMPTLADNYKGFYVGIGASSVDDRTASMTLNNTVYVIDTTAIRSGEIFGGYKYNDALGIELRIGSGLRAGTGNEFDFSGAGGSVNPTVSVAREFGTYESIYYKPELENEDAKLYALLGYTRISASQKRNDITMEKKSYAGTSYGIGIGFVINEHLNINFEYKNICDELYSKPNTSSVNFDYRF